MYWKAEMNTILPDNLRATLAADRDLGCGNFIHTAAQLNQAADRQLFWMDKPCRTFRSEGFDGFSLNTLKEVADDYAAWYYGNGIREKDPVAVYLGEGIKNLIHFTALTGLGAIPILINGNMKPEYAAGFLHKAGAVALFSDTEHLQAIRPHLNADTLSFLATDEIAASMNPGKLPAVYPYPHWEDDPVLVGHSSGTTGIPKAVRFEHQQFFHGIRYRLGLPRPDTSDRILSALPHSHSAGIAYIMLAALSGTPVLVLSNNRPETVLSGIERFHPTMVVAFPETYVELTQADFTRHDMSSIRVWVNGGDAAHEPHIRQLCAVGTWKKGDQTLPGSVFVDGLGSSEMGFSLFRMIHTPETQNYSRCIGQALEWVDAVVLGERGEKLPPYRVGKLGVRAPSVTPGYWNDSVLTARSRVNGYWLTGDLFYRDDQGAFFHVDRVPDAIETAQGMVYSLQTEELFLKSCAGIADCTLVGVPSGTSNVPIALVRLKTGVSHEADELLQILNQVLTENGHPTSIAKLFLVDPAQIPLGPTGKVLKRELRERYQNLFQGKGETHVESRIS